MLIELFGATRVTLTEQESLYSRKRTFIPAQKDNLANFFEIEEEPLFLNRVCVVCHEVSSNAKRVGLEGERWQKDVTSSLLSVTLG